MSLFKKKPVELLEHCVFCGGTPKLTKCGDQKEFLVYLCSRCHETPVRLDEARISEKGARAIWNERTKDARRILNIASLVCKGE